MVVCTGMNFSTGTYRAQSWYSDILSTRQVVFSMTRAHPERVRRDKIKVEQLLCMGYNDASVTRSNFKTAQV